MQEEQEQPPQRISRRTWFIIGAVAGLAMALFMIALRFALDSPILHEVLADRLTRYTPGVVFDFILERLQVGAKPLMFAGILVAHIGLAGGLGLLYGRYSRALPLPESQTWRRGLLLTVVLWLPTVVVFTPIIGGGFLGFALPDGAGDYLISTFVGVAVYSFVLTHLHFITLARAEGRLDMGRRAFLGRVAFAAFLLGAGGLAIRTIARNASSVTPARVFSTRGDLPPEITPNDRFYEVSKNIINPKVDAATWKLEVRGEGVGNPFSLTYQDLQALPWEEEYVTLTCISNSIGGELVSNALWRGVPLRLLLERAQLDPSVKRLAFHAEDGYTDSFPLDYALRDNVLVAYLMNGEPLPDDHGFPARIIVPGLYGMEHVKWLNRIEPVEPDFRGFWQERGWADTAIINTLSRIDVPVSHESTPLQELFVGGIAFAGNRGIDKVEISDDGVTWYEAEVGKPLSPYTWVLWTTRWTPPAAKRFPLRVRATDGDRVIQASASHGSFPDGATGHHVIMVRVQEEA